MKQQVVSKQLSRENTEYIATKSIPLLYHFIFRDMWENLKFNLKHNIIFTTTDSINFVVFPAQNSTYQISFDVSN